MWERLLLGILSLGLPDRSQPEDDAGLTQKALPVEEIIKIITRLQNAAKLHVGMLSCSLIIGLAFGGYMAYSCWMEKNTFRAYIRNLVYAFVCRIFFSILFDGVVILGSNATVEGANALLALECLSQNLVIAHWLLLTVFLHAQIQRHFNSEPTLTIYEYGLPGVAVFFAFVWIFGMQSEFPSIPWLFVLSYIPQWIVNSLRLLYLLVQLGFVVDMGRMMMKTSLDNDSVSLLRKSAAVMAVLVLLFWLQFGFSLGRLPPLKSQSYQYFDFFMDGSLGGFVCLLLFFLDLWVPMFLNRTPSIMAESEEASKRSQEILLTEGRGIDAIDKVFRTKGSGRWKTISEHDSVGEFRDVMYSTVVEPHRLKKTLDLYKRLNMLPNSQATVLDGEKFYDCQTRRSMVSETGDSEKADFRSVISDDSRSVTREDRSKTPKLSDQVQKKNAFYASKYLILDSKEDDFPKFLETRPSVGKKSTREEADKDFFANLDTMIPDELVNKWLNDNSMDLRRKLKPEEPGQANAGVSNEILAQQSTLFHQKPGSAIRASESTTAKTLILTETEVPPQSILQNQKRKLSKSYESDLPIELLESIPKQDSAEATDSLGKEKHQEVHRQSKRIKRAQYPNEFPPKPVPRRQWNKPKPLGKIEAPPNGKVQSKESGTASSTPTPGLPYSPLETQTGFSGVIYSTFNSLLGLGDGLFKSRSSISELDDILVDKSAMFDCKMAGGIPKSTDGYIPFITHSKIEKTENENLQKPILETQSLIIDARQEAEEQEKPSTGQILKPQKHLQATASSETETIADDCSSESTFSIERINSCNSSFTIDNYYAGLMANREKFGNFQ